MDKVIDYYEMWAKYRTKKETVGYVYAPYLPVEITEVVENWAPKKSLTSRYSTKMIDSKYYGTIDIPTIRNTPATLAAMDLVSVQPLDAPTGMLMYLDCVYEETWKSNPYKYLLIA